MYMTAGGLTLVGIFAMRWNVVIGGQLFSKSFLGYTTYKMEMVSREGLLPAILLMLLPFGDFPGAGKAPAAMAGWKGSRSLRRLPCRNPSGRRWSARSAISRSAWRCSNSYTGLSAPASRSRPPRPKPLPTIRWRNCPACCRLWAGLSWA